MNSFRIFVINLLLMISCMECSSILHKRVLRSDRDTRDVYLLVSTSSKIYCMKMPKNLKYSENDLLSEDTNNYEIIYEENKNSNNWITDAFYIKSEDLIYVNVYNSSSSSSNIFTLSYDQAKQEWIKNMLYRDQSYCLGIAYNENQKELYWTASKSIIAGSSINSNQYRVLFNLDAAKKLLYLKYDNISNSIYVSTLNYVYACSLKQNDQAEPCRIIARDLVSARGLYLDSPNRYLYVVDHKKKKVNKIRLSDQPTEDIEASTTLLSGETMPDIGDIFYMCIYNKTNTLIWSEFSGKIKFSNLNDLSNYRLLFSTNEYTYSISLMENSSNTVHFFKPTTTTTFKYSSTRILQTSKAIDVTETVRPIKKLSTKSITSVLTSKAFRITLTTPTITTTTTSTTTASTTTTSSTSTTTATTTTTLATVSTVQTTTAVLNDEPSIDRSLVFKTIESEKNIEDEIRVTKDIQREISTKSLSDDLVLKNEENLEENPNVNFKKQEKGGIKETKTEDIENKSLSLINEKKEEEETTKISYFRSSYLNVSLYVVISLLCLSLIINIILLYVSKIRYSKSMCNNKLMLAHEICNPNCTNANKTATIPSQHSGSGSSKLSKSTDDDETADCNINLIKSNEYLGTHLDSDH